MRGNDLISMMLLCDRSDEYKYIEHILSSGPYFIPMTYGDMRELLNNLIEHSSLIYNKYTKVFNGKDKKAYLKLDYHDGGVYIKALHPDIKVIVDEGNVLVVHHADPRVGDSQVTCNDIRNRISKYARAIVTRALCYREGPRTANKLRDYLDLTPSHFSACIWEVRAFGDESANNISEFFKVDIDDKQHLIDMFHSAVRLTGLQRYLVAALFARL